MNGQEYVKYDFDYHHRQQNMAHEQHSYHATNYQNHNDCNRFPVIEPPSWACPARGESTLEPVCETVHTHPPVDLTNKRWYRIGRSPSSDVPLLHTTSSRRHALLFHHPNGACYLADCNSAHGTYLDGKRVAPYPHPPKRVRRGALIRFGGEGAPTFVLKTFSVRLEEMIHDLGGVTDAFFPQLPENNKQTQPQIICESSSYEDEEATTRNPTTICATTVPTTPILSPKHIEVKKSKTKSNGVLACIRGDGGGVACIANSEDAPEAALVLLNTRLNAWGRRALECEYNRRTATFATEKFERLGAKRKRCTSPTFTTCTGITTHTNKRSKKSILKKSPESPANFRDQQIFVVPESTSPHYFQATSVVKPVRRRKIYFEDECKPEIHIENNTNPNEVISDEETSVDKSFPL